MAQAFLIGEDLAGAPSALVLGDKTVWSRAGRQLGRANAKTTGASVFAYQVNDPERYGVVEFDREGQALSLKRNPASPSPGLP